MSQEELLRTRVLKAAGEAILSRGYSRMTMDELAAGLRVSKKTLYRLFSSKEALGHAVLESTLEEISASLRAIVEDRALDFDARLARVVHTITMRYGEAGRALDDLQRDAPELWDRLLELRRAAVQDNLGRVFASGLRDGVIRTDVEPRLVVRMVLTLVDQLLRPTVLAELELSAEAAYAQMLSVIGAGLRGGAKAPAGLPSEATVRGGPKRPAAPRRKG